MENSKRSTDHKNDKRNKTGGCLAFLALIIMVMAFIPICLLAAGNYLLHGDEIEKVDAIVVLSGAEGERVEEASGLFLGGYARHFVITVTDAEDIGEARTYSEKLMRIAIEMGVPQDAMFFTEGAATSTEEEAQAVKSLAEMRNLQSLLVITDPYHTRRTALIFHEVFRNSEISILVHAVQDHWYKPETWFLSRLGWEVTIQEYLKLNGFYLSKILNSL